MIADRVKETTTTTGTGSLVLAGAAAQFRSFNAAFGAATPFYYVLTDANGTGWEVGSGQLSDATTLVRSSVLKSSNADAKISLSSGTHTVFCAAPEAFLTGLAPKVSPTLTTPNIGDATASKLTVTSGSLTSSTPALDATQTWNSAGTTFTGLKLNVTDTASASGSLLMDLQVGGTSQFNVTKGGSLTLGGQAGNPAIDIQAGGTNFPALKFSQGSSLRGRIQYHQTAGWMQFDSANGGWSFANALVGFSSAAGTAPDTIITRDAAQTLAQRNGTNAQKFFIYNTYTDASNYEAGFVRWEGNTLQVGTGKAGTGNARELALTTDFTSRWRVVNTGHFLATLDNAYDIGASSVNRPRSAYIGTNLVVGGAAAATVSTPPVDITQTWNNAAVAFTGLRLNFTDTASAAGSLPLDIQVGGTSQFNVSKSGVVVFRPGSSSAPSITFAGRTGAGMYLASNAHPVITTQNNGPAAYFVDNASFCVQFSRPVDFGVSGDALLTKDAAQTLAQRNSTNAQTFRVYNTFTDASNYERGKFSWSSNVLQIGTEKAGTGTARSLEFQTDGTTRLTVGTAGGVTVADANDLILGSTTGTKIGTATTQKLAFFNSSPVVQPAAVADATDNASAITQLNALLSRLRTLGLIAT